MPFFTKQADLDAREEQIAALQQEIATLRASLAAAAKREEEFPKQLAEERRLRVAAEQDSGKAKRELAAKVAAAEAEFAGISKKLREAEEERASDRRAYIDSAAAFNAKIDAQGAALDRAKAENVALAKEHDATLRSLAKLRSDFAALQNAHDVLEVAQARIRREHEDQLAREVAAHAATKRQIKAHQE